MNKLSIIAAFDIAAIIVKNYIPTPPGLYKMVLFIFSISLIIGNIVHYYYLKLDLNKIQGVIFLIIMSLLFVASTSLYFIIPEIGMGVIPTICILLSIGLSGICVGWAVAAAGIQFASPDPPKS